MTSAPRIDPLDPPYTPESATLLSKLMGPVDHEPLKLFRTLAVHDQLASRMRPLAAGILAHPRIDPRERELLILRTRAPPARRARPAHLLRRSRRGTPSRAPDPSAATCTPGACRAPSCAMSSPPRCACTPCTPAPPASSRCLPPPPTPHAASPPRESA